ncbi:hypothetical protein PS2_035201 [Malus domestica]
MRGVLVGSCAGRYAQGETLSVDYHLFFSPSWVGPLWLNWIQRDGVQGPVNEMGSIQSPISTSRKTESEVLNGGIIDSWGNSDLKSARKENMAANFWTSSH